MKTCNRCGQAKDPSEFYVDRSTKDGLGRRCRDCVAAYYRENKAHIREQSKVYRAERAEEIAAAKRQYYSDPQNRALKCQHDKEYHNEHLGEIKAQTKQWRDEHKELISQRRKTYIADPEHHTHKLLHDRQYHAIHRDENNRRRKAHYEAHKEHHRKLGNQWRRSHPGHRRIEVHIREARLRGNGGRFTHRQWEAVKRDFNYTCPMCGRREPEIKLSIDHVVPVALGGKNSIENIQPLCISCNSQKHTKIIDFRGSTRAAEPPLRIDLLQRLSEDLAGHFTAEVPYVGREKTMGKR
jgi:5-methylcytosine-specific restriction endonuclease McrA